MNPTTVHMTNCQIQLFMNVKILKKKHVEHVWPEHLALLTGECITLKLLNTLTKFDKFSWLGSLKVTH